MIEQKNTTGPVEEQALATTEAAPTTDAQAPIPGTENKTPATTSTEAKAETTQTPATASTTAASTTALPEGYLANGSILGDDGAIRPEYIGKYAQILAGKLKPLKASAFYTAFLKEAKEARKKKVAYGAKKNCALGMVTQAKKLKGRKKEPAPAVLVDMITAATATVDSPATFEALYMHLDAVYSYLLTD